MGTGTGDPVCSFQPGYLFFEIDAFFTCKTALHFNGRKQVPASPQFPGTLNALCDMFGRFVAGSKTTFCNLHKTTVKLKKKNKTKRDPFLGRKYSNMSGFENYCQLVSIWVPEKLGRNHNIVERIPQKHPVLPGRLLFFSFRTCLNGPAFIVPFLDPLQWKGTDFCCISTMCRGLEYMLYYLKPSPQQPHR